MAHGETGGQMPGHSGELVGCTLLSHGMALGVMHTQPSQGQEAQFTFTIAAVCETAQRVPGGV